MATQEVAEQPHNPDFEALVELLTTEDSSHDIAPFQSVRTPGREPSPPAPRLRHPDGRFDFSRVRSYFEQTDVLQPDATPLPRSRSVSPEQQDDDTEKYAGVFSSAKDKVQTVSEETTLPVQSPNTADTAPHPETFHQENPTSSSPSVPSPHLLSISPLTLPPSDIPALTNIGRSQSEPTTSVAGYIDSARKREKVSSIMSPPRFSVHREASRGGDSPKSQPFDGEEYSHLDQRELLEALERTLAENHRQTQALNQALDFAKAETADLRQQCDELRSLISDVRFLHRSDSQNHSFGQPTRSPDPNQTTLRRGNSASNREAQTRETSNVEAGSDSFSHTAPLDEIDLMASDDLRHNLKTLLISLSLPMRPPVETAIPLAPEGQPPRSINDIMRALDFVRKMDTLVWRTPSRASGLDNGGNRDIFGEENIQSLEDRFRLWERAVRHPITRRKA